MQQRPDDTGLMVAGVIIVLATLGAYITLTLTGYGADTTELLAFITPVVAALLIIRKVDSGQGRQEQVLQTIQRQTNGELDRRVREGTLASLKAVGLIEPDVVRPARFPELEYPEKGLPGDDPVRRHPTPPPVD